MNANIEITVYTMVNCSFCEKQKQWMRENGIEFNEKEITKNSQNYQEFLQYKVHGTPLTIWQEANKENRVTGFNKGKLDKLLKVSEKSSETSV